MKKHSITEALGLGKTKKVSSIELRGLIQETYQAILKEEEEAASEKKEGSGSYASYNDLTNIKGVDLDDLWSQLTSGDANAPLIKAMETATGWSKGAFASAGGAEAVKKWAESVGEVELKNRVGQVGSALPGSAPDKQDMPALEGGDGAAVADALGDTSGEFAVDISSAYADGKEDFDTWYKNLPEDERTAYEQGEVPEIKDDADGSKDSEKVKESILAHIGNLILEDKYPRDGMGPMKGAPEKGEKSPHAKRGEIVGRALAFLTKGMVDGEEGDDQIDVQVSQGMQNSDMIPTQSNILAGKSLLFAFLHGTGATDLGDMGGAFVTTANEILDGHHRWSGAYIATGGSQGHTNVHKVAGNAKELIPLLVSVGNALGRAQKGQKDESVRPSDDVLLERWSRLAGIL